MQVQGKRGRRKPKKRRLDYTRDDMKEYEMTKDMTQNRSVWHKKINAGPLLAYIKESYRRDARYR